MRNVVLCLMVSTWVAWVGGCAETGVCRPGERLVDGVCAPEVRRCDDTISRSMPVGCMLSDEAHYPTPVNYDWKLTVEPLKIRSGEPFFPVVSGELLVRAEDLNAAMGVLGPFTRVEVLRAEGRITVRGARVVEGGNPIVLQSAIPKTCTYDDDGNPGLGAGPFGPCSDDSDCVDPPGEPDPRENRCAPFVDFEIQTDCEVCSERGYGKLCNERGFCAEGPAIGRLGPATGEYQADGPGSVFFGWADGADFIEFGADRGAVELSKYRRRTAEDEIKFTGFDVLLGSPELRIPVSFECVMGVASRGPDGPPTANVLISPAPSGMLISCPIE